MEGRGAEPRGRDGGGAQVRRWSPGRKDGEGAEPGGKGAEPGVGGA